jgi:hypothetical protein
MKVIAISAAILVLSAGLAFAQAGSGSGANVPETSKNARSLPESRKNRRLTSRRIRPRPPGRLRRLQALALDLKVVATRKIKRNELGSARSDVEE